MLILFFVLLPCLAFIICSFLPNHFERIISGIAVISIFAVLCMFVWTLLFWWQAGFVPLSQQGPILFSSNNYVFAADFYMDVTSAVFFGTTCLITILVLLFSRFYMHRDPGFLRFHMMILLFFMGLILIIFSGNFETLFVGWELIGISSFLLISFYRDRFLPVRNGLKVFSLYRIGDAILILALWYAHHLFGHNVQFVEFNSLIGTYGNSLVILGILFFLVAIIKSAQFPFSYWLPRAMEGPTTSSAIFYGALSSHIGLFLLLRTYPLWEGSIWFRVVIIISGLLTALIATSITRVQSSIKTQIAYASVTQIGIMFIELALGLHWLALFHFLSNACLRTYQLLVSPSVLSYFIHNQFYNFVTPIHNINKNFIGKIRSTLFILGVKEWNMDSNMTYFIWQPIKRLGRQLKLLDKAWVVILCAVLMIGQMYFFYITKAFYGLATSVIWVNGIFSLLFFIRAYANKANAMMCWNQIFLGQLFVSLFLGMFSGAVLLIMFLYLAGILVAYLVGLICLTLLSHKTGQYSLKELRGQIYLSPVLGKIFFLACLAMMAFPITPSFMGEEMLLTLIPLANIVQIAIFALGYIFSGICTMRLFAKIFFGPYKDTHHEIAYRSS